MFRALALRQREHDNTVMCMHGNNWVRRSREVIVDGHCGRGTRARKTWDEVILLLHVRIYSLRYFSTG